LVSGIATGVISYKELNVPDPIAVAADHAGLGWMSSLIKLGAIAGLSSVILVMLLGQSRVFYSMSRDGLLPQFVNKVHPTFKTPAVWLVAPLGAISALSLMVALPWRTWERLIIWFVVGIVIYFAYGVGHSKLASKS